MPCRLSTWVPLSHTVTEPSLLPGRLSVTCCSTHVHAPLGQVQLPRPRLAPDWCGAYRYTSPAPSDRHISRVEKPSVPFGCSPPLTSVPPKSPGILPPRTNSKSVGKRTQYRRYASSSRLPVAGRNIC